MEDNWERIGRARLEQSRRQWEDHICKTNARQLGDKWEATSERQLGNNGAANGRHLENNWKTNSGRQMGIVEGNWKTIGRPHLGDKWQTTRQQPKKTWRQLGDNIWETTSGRHLGDKWKITSGRKLEDN